MLILKVYNKATKYLDRRINYENQEDEVCLGH